jgi:esterase/lipase
MSEIHELKRKKRLRLAAMEKLKQEKAISKRIDDLEAKKKSVVISEKLELAKEMEKEEEEEEEEQEKKPKKMDDPLVRTNVPFGGVINELKKRFPMYKSDITDSLR